MMQIAGGILLAYLVLAFLPELLWLTVKLIKYTLIALAVIIPLIIITGVLG